MTANVSVSLTDTHPLVKSPRLDSGKECGQYQLGYESLSVVSTSWVMRV